MNHIPNEKWRFSKVLAFHKKDSRSPMRRGGGNFCYPENFYMGQTKQSDYLTTYYLN